MGDKCMPRYEFAVYSFLEPYFQENFFAGSAISTWLGFACTFVARPFGGIVIGVIGDIFGRKVSTFLSIFGMLIGTVGQGLVPSYASGQVAGTIGLVLLVSLRFLQGICTGGEIAAVSTYITEVGPKSCLARSMALIGITCNVGFLAAQLVSYLALELLGEEMMLEWGWRLPFLIAGIPGLIATLGRRCMPESNEFLEARAAAVVSEPGADAEEEVSESNGSSSDVKEGSKRAAASAKMRSLLGSYWGNILVGIGAVVAVSTLQYGGLVWCNIFLKKRGASPDHLIAAGVTARILSILLSPFTGWLADVKGVAWLHLLGALMLTCTGLPLYLVMLWHPTSLAAVLLAYGVGFGVIFAFTGMIFFLYVVELFPVQVRNAGVGLSYNIGFCAFGGFAPMVFEAAYHGYLWGPGWLLSLAGLVTALTTLVSLRLQKSGRMQLVHERPVPYFSQCGCDPVADAEVEEQADPPSVKV
ncbi:unnamed protein product [Effrenium voratum]|nr:unnamed protein product [Effrenium voratum]